MPVANYEDVKRRGDAACAELDEWRLDADRKLRGLRARLDAVGSEASDENIRELKALKDAGEAILNRGRRLGLEVERSLGEILNVLEGAGYLVA